LKVFSGALLFCSLLLYAHAFASNPNAYQQRFEEGVIAMGNNPEDAAAIFEKLYVETNAVRVQLEWARSLFLAGRLAEAKSQFIDIIDKPIPIVVRDKVEWYLSEIQKRQSFKFVFGVFQDSNPGYITSARTVSILGQTLSYQPTQPAHTETGLNIGAELEREIVPQSGFFAQVGANTVTYQTSAYNKQNYDASFVKRWQDYNYKDLKAGFETMYYGGYALYSSPYISTKFIFNLPNQDYYGFMAKTASLNYPTYTYLNGSQTQGNIFYNHNITRNLTANMELGVDTTPATQAAYSSNGIYGSLGTQIAEDSTNLQANLKASLSQRNYRDSDPLWGVIRHDSSQLYFLSITKRNFYLLGLRPSIDITYQTNNSNIPFFTYNKLFGGIFLKNVY
jgi:Surface lipoprotein assembly modifier